jgi:hypothetical protein
MTICITSFDFDGCLFHAGYVSNPSKDIIAANQSLLSSLLNEKKNFTKTITLIGSSRQSYFIDLICRAKTGSCFPAIQTVSDYLGSTLDPFLLADIYAKLPSGTAFHRAISQDNHEEHPDWVYDGSKLSILYAQTHKVAKDHPNENILFKFYDDQMVILDELHNLYSQHPEALPDKVILQLNHYDGGKVSSKFPITGLGKIDLDYPQTLIKQRP